MLVCSYCVGKRCRFYVDSSLGGFGHMRSATARNGFAPHRKAIVTVAGGRLGHLRGTFPGAGWSKGSADGSGGRPGVGAVEGEVLAFT